MPHLDSTSRPSTSWNPSFSKTKTHRDAESAGETDEYTSSVRADRAELLSRIAQATEIALQRRTTNPSSVNFNTEDPTSPKHRNAGLSHSDQFSSSQDTVIIKRKDISSERMKLLEFDDPQAAASTAIGLNSVHRNQCTDCDISLSLSSAHESLHEAFSQSVVSTLRRSHSPRPVTSPCFNKSATLHHLISTNSMDAKMRSKSPKAGTYSGSSSVSISLGRVQVDEHSIAIVDAADDSSAPLRFSILPNSTCSIQQPTALQSSTTLSSLRQVTSASKFQKNGSLGTSSRSNHSPTRISEKEISHRNVQVHFSNNCDKRGEKVYTVRLNVREWERAEQEICNVPLPGKSSTRKTRVSMWDTFQNTQVFPASSAITSPQPPLPRTLYTDMLAQELANPTPALPTAGISSRTSVSGVDSVNRPPSPRSSELQHGDSTHRSSQDTSELLASSALLAALQAPPDSEIAQRAASFLDATLTSPALPSAPFPHSRFTLGSSFRSTMTSLSPALTSASPRIVPVSTVPPQPFNGAISPRNEDLVSRSRPLSARATRTVDRSKPVLMRNTSPRAYREIFSPPPLAPSSRPVPKLPSMDETHYEKNALKLVENNRSGRVTSEAKSRLTCVSGVPGINNDENSAYFRKHSFQFTAKYSSPRKSPYRATRCSLSPFTPKFGSSSTQFPTMTRSPSPHSSVSTSTRSNDQAESPLSETPVHCIPADLAPSQSFFSLQPLLSQKHDPTTKRVTNGLTSTTIPVPVSNRTLNRQEIEAYEAVLPSFLYHAIERCILDSTMHSVLHGKALPEVANADGMLANVAEATLEIIREEMGCTLTPEQLLIYPTYVRYVMENTNLMFLSSTSPQYSEKQTTVPKQAMAHRATTPEKRRVLKDLNQRLKERHMHS